jgi:polysaccharide export outer membrane protein
MLMAVSLLTCKFFPENTVKEMKGWMSKDRPVSLCRCRRMIPQATVCLAVALLLFLPTPVRCQTPLLAKESTEAGRLSLRQSVVPDAAGNTEYVIDAGDVLDVYVVDVPQFSRDYRVGSDGKITMPLLPLPVTAEGLTLSQLSALVSQKLRAAELVTHPHVVVSVKTSALHTVAVSGAVRNPLIYSLFTPTTLLDALSQAGGLAPDAGSTATITRRALRAASSRVTRDSSPPPAEGPVKVNLQKLLATGDPNLNVTIYPGDKITVQRAGVVYVIGAVQRPGGFPLSKGSDRMTVLQAVALGEGLKTTALRKKGMIIRRGPQFPRGREEIPVNLKHILSGRASDPGLQANDILYIPDSNSKRALRRGAEAALQMATGVVIWGRY